MKRSITLQERLTATLTYLETGITYEDLKFALSNIIRETYDVIYKVLKQEYLKVSKMFINCNSSITIFLKEVPLILRPMLSQYV